MAASPRPHSDFGTFALATRLALAPTSRIGMMCGHQSLSSRRGSGRAATENLN
jgi:hypothetical protein